MKDSFRLALIAAAVAWLAACGSRQEEQTTEAAAAPEESASEEATPAVPTRKVCELKLTAPVEKEWVMYWDQERVNAGGGNDSYAKSVHWANDQEREAMKDNPEALAVACRQEQDPLLMVVLDSFGSTASDIPAGPGTYPVVPKSQDGKVKPGTFIATVLFEKGMFDVRGGSITVEKLDTTGVVGTFVVEAAEMPVYGNRQLRVEGKFDLPCIGGTLESLCTAPERREY
jgi:hypothetical protein